MTDPIKAIEEEEKKRKDMEKKKRLEIEENQNKQKVELKQKVFPKMKAEIEALVFEKCKSKEPELLAEWGYGGKYKEVYNRNHKGYYVENNLLSIVNRRFVLQVEKVYGHVIDRTTSIMK